MHAWEIPAIVIQNSVVYNEAIVLGTVARYDKDLGRVQFTESADRIFQAIDLYRKGKIKKIIYSGGAGSLINPDEADAPFVKSYLIGIGIPEQDILIEDASRNTHENAQLVKPILDSLSKGTHGDKKYLLITSAYHMRRAKACFEKAGIAVTPYSTDRISGPLKFDLSYILVPDAFTFASWFILFHEFFGCVFYKLAGYT